MVIEWLQESFQIKELPELVRSFVPLKSVLSVAEGVLMYQGRIVISKCIDSQVLIIYIPRIRG